MFNQQRHGRRNYMEQLYSFSCCEKLITTIHCIVESTSFKINNIIQYANATPLFFGGQTALPIRSIIEALGGSHVD